MTDYYKDNWNLYNKKQITWKNIINWCCTGKAANGINFIAGLIGIVAGLVFML